MIEWDLFLERKDGSTYQNERKTRQQNEEEKI